MTVAAVHSWSCIQASAVPLTSLYHSPRASLSYPCHAIVPSVSRSGCSQHLPISDINHNTPAKCYSCLSNPQDLLCHPTSSVPASSVSISAQNAVGHHLSAVSCIPHNTLTYKENKSTTYCTSVSSVAENRPGLHSSCWNAPQIAAGDHKSLYSVPQNWPGHCVATDNSHTADWPVCNYSKPCALRGSQPHLPSNKEVFINLVDTCSELSDDDVLFEHKRKKESSVQLKSSRPKSKMFLQRKVMKFSILKANHLIHIQIQESENSQNVGKRKQKSKRRSLMAVGNRQAKNKDGSVDSGQPVDGVGCQPCDSRVSSKLKSKQRSSVVVERVDNRENYVDSQQPVDNLASPSCEDDVDMDTVTSLPPFQVPQERKVSHFSFHMV